MLGLFCVVCFAPFSLVVTSNAQVIGAISAYSRSISQENWYAQLTNRVLSPRCCCTKGSTTLFELDLSACKDPRIHCVCKRGGVAIIPSQPISFQIWLCIRICFSQEGTCQGPQQRRHQTQIPHSRRRNRAGPDFSAYAFQWWEYRKTVCGTPFIFCESANGTSRVVKVSEEPKVAQAKL